MRTNRIIFLAAWLVALAPMAGEAQPPGLQRKIVVFQKQVGRQARETVVRGVGGAVLKHLRLIDGAAVELPAPAVAALMRKAEVKRVDEDLTITAIGQPAPAQPVQQTPWGITQIHAPSAWGQSTGAEVKLAVLDTGIKLNHRDLQANIAGGANVINPRKPADDDNGHGTHVAGTIGAVNNTIGVVGGAPQVRLYAVKVLARNGSGYLSDLVDGLTWCIDNQVRVVNMSLGSSSDNQSFHEAITAASAAGLTLVAAAGNEGRSQVSYPAAYPEVIAVTATDNSNNLASFSNYGSAVDLAAPGVSIYSTWNDGGYKTLSGTSMASPHVAAVVALRLALHPGETASQVKQVLEATARDLGPAGWDPRSGAGLVDAAAAVSAP